MNQATDMQHQKLETSLGAKDKQIEQLQTAIVENKETLVTEELALIILPLDYKDQSEPNNHQDLMQEKHSSKQS